MAFSLGNINNALGGGSANGEGGLTQGPDLEVIQTEGLGFLALNGEAKVQLTPRWSPLPAPTASLMSIAARRGLVAAAGPDGIYVATTEAVRSAFKSKPAEDSGSEVRPFEPQAKVPLQIRVSQLAFTADEQYLIVCAEVGGGLAVYHVDSLAQGSASTVFEISTNGEAVRALVPNPAATPDLAGYCAIVTDKGSLLMANLGEKHLVTGADGPVLRSQVSCVAWSTRGKQLVAGMADGTLHQMTPEGADKGRIPKPPSLGDFHVSSVSWLENHKFLVIHNVTNGQDPSVFHLISREQPPGGAAPVFTFQKLADPVEPFGSDKVPHHTVLRLKDFAPSLQDLLVVASTATELIGLLTRSKTPLASDKPADKITNVFTTTELADDSKRAQLPMSEDYMETFAIGAALDLSSKDKVEKPIPSDEIEESPGPLPGLWVLNNEGVLSSWWIVYNDSIRAGTTYEGISAVSGPAPAPAQPPAVPASSSSSAFGAQTTNSPFGAPSTSTPAFGGAPALGAKASPWATPAGTSSPSPFGSLATKPAETSSPAFGAPSAFGSKPTPPAFGQSSSMGLGNKTSPWASMSTSTGQSAFGQSGFGGSTPGNASADSGKVFGSGAATGGFASFANKGGFSSLGGNSEGTNIFASKSGGTLGSSSPFGAPKVNETAFPSVPKNESTPGFGSSPFVLGTTFKADPKNADDNEKPTPGGGGSLFGGGFGLSLSDTPKQPPAAPETKDEDMDAPTPAEEKPKSIFSLNSTTPTTTPAAPKFGLPATSGPATTTSIFGAKPAAEGPTSTTNIFGIFGTPKPAAPEAPKTSIFGTPEVKEEEEDKENMANIPEAPLPPESTRSLAPNDAPLPPDFLGKPKAPRTEDAPLPPDFLSKPKEKPEAAPLPPDFISKPKADMKLNPAEAAPLPPDFLAKKPAQAPPRIPQVPDSPEEDDLSEDDLSEDEASGSEEGDDAEAGSEGSGIDVAKDLSPRGTALTSQTPGFTPQSSFDMAGSAFSTISRTEIQQPSRSLFGEVRQQAPPLFPKHVPQSPRSPSPVRGPGGRPNSLRFSETQRSVSAPGMASHILGSKPQQQQTKFGFSGVGSRPVPAVDPNVAEQRRSAARREAETQPLQDPEDEGIQQILQSEIEPTLRMDEFLAVDSKLEAIKSAGQNQIPDACEALWRDVNRMIDRLGLNSRSLQAFILGHTTQFKRGGRTKEDLEHPDEWVLVEAEELSMVVESELAQDLEEARVKDIEATEAAIHSIGRDLTKLRAKEEDMRKIIMAHVDPDQVAVTKSLPLSAEQAAQQNELRRAYASFSKLLAEAEESLTLLKAKMVAAGGPSGKTQVPTVDAVIRTINKMTSMAEKRSGDIDVLESHMRRIRLTPAALRASTQSPGPRSREGSPFIGSASVNSPHRRSLLMSPERMRDSLSSPVGPRGAATPPHKKMSMYSEEEKKVVRTKLAKRKDMFQLLRDRLEKAGPNVSRLGDDDA
ncbi:hypothetical protein GQ53DRAFT_661637 [Thozetella sp. PMI_491]|nr:hypothetical protein GQ53DRAFT_661637 [Thozetella sp. PMI_491]